MPGARSLVFSCLLFALVPTLLSQNEPAPPAQAAAAEPEVQSQQPAAPAEELTPEKRADIYMARKMYREAIDQYKKAPQTYGVINKIGIAYHQLTELDLAERQYKRSAKMNPKYYEAVNNLGTIYYAKKNYRRAISYYRKALKLSPESASIQSNLGTAYFARKKYKEAFEAYQKALALDPEVFEHRNTFGTTLQDRNIEERAIYHYYLAKTYAGAGVNDRALLYIRRALEEGFKDRKKFLEEPEFTAIRELPEFKELMAVEPRVLE